jgi:hypothetical protein
MCITIKIAALLVVARQRQPTLKTEAVGSFETYVPKVFSFLEHHVVWTGVSVSATAARTSNISLPASQPLSLLAS